MKSFRLSIVSVGLLALLFAGSATYLSTGQDQEPQMGGMLTVAVPSEPPGLNPTTNTAADIDRIVYNNIYEGLLKLDRNGDVVPGLAKALPEVSDDGLTWTFELREDVTFHDGSDLTAEDVVATMERNMTSDEIPNPQYYDAIESVSAVDEHTVQFTLSERDAKFQFDLARGDSVILPDGGGEALQSEPNGTGPFQFVEWVRGDHVTLERNPDYYGTDANGNRLPYLDRVEFRFIPDASAQIAALRAGDVDAIGYDLSPSNAQQLDQAPNFKVLNGVTTTDVILAMNNSREPFDDVRVRRAVSYAIDRQELIEGAMFGFGSPIGAHMSPINPRYVDLTSRYGHDPEQAQALLEDAGHGDGLDVTLQLPQQFGYAVRSGEIIAQQLGEVGINVEIQVIDFGQWVDRVFSNADYDLSIIGHAEAFDISIYANPDYYFQYDNPRLQDIIARAERTSDLEEQKKLYAIAQWIIADDAVNGYLFELPSLPAMRTDVQGWWEDYPVPALDVTEVWMDQ